jgi:hypothetical protein
VHRKILSRLCAAVFFLAAALNLSAQGTAIFYQGRLNVAGVPANTNYDLRFAVYDAVTNGNRISLSLTNFAVPVSNGLFSVTLDFGPGIFNGTANGSNDWLDIGVRAIGVTNFTVLAPRQPILPVPYALFAVSASNLLGSLQSTQLVGRVASAQISGTYSNSVNFSSGANTFAGTFSGDGSNLGNLNAGNVSAGTLADARLSGNVALLNANQTFIGANTFNGNGAYNGVNTFTGGGTYSGVNTFSNNANYFQGSFFGNGLVGWIAISGTATTAMRDAGYMLQNASLTSLTLPASASLTPGDIVRVSGAGTGGWLVKENAGQSILGNFAAYRNGYLVALPLDTLPINQDYHGVAASADGIRVYAVGNSLTGVYASSDRGRTWTQVSSNQLSGTWFSVACSANGKIVYVEPYSGGVIQKSSDSGMTWSSSGVSATATFISCSADGGTLFPSNYACSGNGTYLARVVGGVINYSINGGSTWNSILTAPAAGVTCLGVSSDCTRMVAGVNNGSLYATSNQGQTWTQLTATSQVWSGAWMSPDGSKFAATVSKSGGVNGSINYCDVSALPNTVSTTSTGSLCGSQGSAVELQFLGGGQFMPVSSTGLIWAN